MYRTSNVLLHAFLQIALLILGLAGFNLHSLAASNVEETFLQGQRYLEQANVAQASVSLARLPSQSPYAKLLSGNIAAQQGNTDQAFLLLLPLQSNSQFIRPAAASLHASLGSAYEKQGAYFNALEHMTRHETYLDDTAAIPRNHANIWRLLSTLTTANLIELRGESTDSVIQGWIDLSLATKQQNVGEGITNWASSYPDHPASIFASTLYTAPANIAGATSTKPVTSLKESAIALILPFDHDVHKAHAEAFKLGLQSALTHHGMPNEIRLYATLGDPASFAEVYARARDEGVAYFIGPLSKDELSADHANIQALTLLDANLPGNQNLQHAGYSLQDEAEAIANYASRNGIQRIAILTSESALAQMQVASFAAEWETRSDNALNIISLPAEVKYITLLNLKDSLAAYQSEMVLLALSAQEAIKIKPYLDASMPTIGFSSLNERVGDAKPSVLHAIRFVDIPYLTEQNNADFSVYREASSALATNELLRWFALGVDYLPLLAAKTGSPDTEVILHGLTGTLLIDAQGQIKRQLPMARFTYDGIVLDSH